jgi:hypothetical protein
MSFKSPRLLIWLVASAVLSILALYVQAKYPGNVLAVTLYKAHLLSLGGWGGYWLDRALFPYDRPHVYLEPDAADAILAAEGMATAELVASDAYGMSMLRRAIIVAAALICVGLGA